jgi:hypothetical protein
MSAGKHWAGITQLRNTVANMYRWTARFVVSVMLVPSVVPVIGPLALARVAPAEGMHCMRRPLAETAAAVAVPAAEPAMHCHHQAAQSTEQSVEHKSVEHIGGPASSEASFRSVDCCCNHDCCRSVTTSEWAQPAGRHSSYVSLLTESAVAALAAARVLSPLIGADSARAPPRG